MARAPAQKPDNNAGTGDVSGTDASSAWSGTRDGHGSDATNLEGQYPPGPWGTALFGGPLPDGTGAPGTQGQKPGQAGTDPTNQPGQTSDGLTGISDQFISSTGLSGSVTQPAGEGGASTVSYTIPGAGVSGTYHSETQQEDLSGPLDSTQANEQGYATGGPQLPGTKGNEPQPGGKYQPGGGGRVLRGGRAVRG
ncbi:MAG TPA: hypothetical protein VNH17_12520 [Streptosporangiaceae bacterium]|nr:hypothetical protein [Streptosporangiaceae bacterium]